MHSVSKNAATILAFMQKAKDGGADIVHFSECALSGYAGPNHDTLDGFDWDLLRSKTQEIMALAGTIETVGRAGQYASIDPAQ